MKKAFILAVLALLFVGNGLFAQQAPLTLDDAISTAVAEITSQIPDEGKRLAVINIESEYKDVSKYVVTNLIIQLIKTRHFKLVSRDEVEMQRAADEQALSESGLISKESAIKLGQAVSADLLLTGKVLQTSPETYQLSLNVYDAMYNYMGAAAVTVANDRNFKQLAVGTGTKLYENFTVQQRLGTTAANLAFGLGSFVIEKDMLGGGITAGAEGLGAVLFIAAIAFQNSEYGSLSGSPKKEGGYDRYGNYTRYESAKPGITESFYAYPFFVGIGFYVGGFIFGGVRAWMYDKPNTGNAKTAFGSPDGLQLDLVPSKAGYTPGLKVGYKWSF